MLRNDTRVTKLAVRLLLSYPNLDATSNLAMLSLEVKCYLKKEAVEGENDVLVVTFSRIGASRSHSLDY